MGCYPHDFGCLQGSKDCQRKAQPDAHIDAEAQAARVEQSDLRDN
jgi:hypothetical protein